MKNRRKSEINFFGSSCFFLGPCSFLLLLLVGFVYVIGNSPGNILLLSGIMDIGGCVHIKKRRRWRSTTHPPCYLLRLRSSRRRRRLKRIMYCIPFHPLEPPFFHASWVLYEDTPSALLMGPSEEGSLGSSPAPLVLGHVFSFSSVNRFGGLIIMLKRNPLHADGD